MQRDGDKIGRRRKGGGIGVVAHLTQFLRERQGAVPRLTHRVGEGNLRAGRVEHHAHHLGECRANHREHDDGDEQLDHGHTTAP